MGEMGRAFDGSYTWNMPCCRMTRSTPSNRAALGPTGCCHSGNLLPGLRFHEESEDPSIDQVWSEGATSGVGVAFAKVGQSPIPRHRDLRQHPESRKGQRLLAAGFTEYLEDRNGILDTEEVFDKILELIGPAAIKDSLSHINEAASSAAPANWAGSQFLEDFDPIME